MKQQVSLSWLDICAVFPSREDCDSFSKMGQACEGYLEFLMISFWLHVQASRKGCEPHADLLPEEGLYVWGLNVTVVCWLDADNIQLLSQLDCQPGM